MSYGIRYRIEWSDTFSEGYRIDILEKNYVGSIKDLLAAVPAFVLGTTDTEEMKFTEFLSQKGELSIVTTDTFRLSNLYSEDPEQYQVEFYRSNVLRFKGWIDPFNSFEDFTDAPYVIRVACSDGISRLKTKPFVDPVTEKTIGGRKSLIEIITICLSRTGLGLPFTTGVNTYEYTELTGLNEDPLAQLHLDVALFREDGVPFSCYDILKQILTVYNLSLFQADGRWWLLNTFERTGEYAVRSYNAGGQFLISALFDETVDFGRGQALKPVNGALEGVYRPLKKIETYLQYTGVANILLNGDFSEMDGESLLAWSGTAFYERVGDGSVNLPYAVEIAGSGFDGYGATFGQVTQPDNQYLDSEEFAVTPDSFVDIGLSTLGLNVNRAKIAVIGRDPVSSALQYLTRDGLWTSTPTTISIETIDIIPLASWTATRYQIRTSKVGSYTRIKVRLYRGFVDSGAPTDPKIRYLAITGKGYQESELRTPVGALFAATGNALAQNDADQQGVIIGASPVDFLFLTQTFKSDATTRANYFTAIGTGVGAVDLLLQQVMQRALLYRLPSAMYDGETVGDFYTLKDTLIWTNNGNKRLLILGYKFDYSSRQSTLRAVEIEDTGATVGYATSLVYEGDRRVGLNVANAGGIGSINSTVTNTFTQQIDLPDTGVVPDTYGGDEAGGGGGGGIGLVTPQIAVDKKGRIREAANLPIDFAELKTVTVGDEHSAAVVEFDEQGRIINLTVRKSHQHPWFTGLPVPTCVVGRPTGEIQYNLTLYMAEGLSASDLRIVRVVNPVDWATVTWEGLFPTISATFPHVGAELPLLLVENGRDPLHPVQTLVELPVEVLPEMTPFITISLRSEVGLDPPHASESVVMELGAGQNYAAWIGQWDVYYAITTGGHTQLVMGIYWQDDSGYVQRVADRVYDTTGIESGLFQLFSDGLSSDTVPTLDGQPLGQGFYDFTFALYNGDTLLHQTNRLLEFGPPVCDVPPVFSTFFRSDAIYNITNTSLWYDFHSLNVDVQSVACWRKSDNALQWEVEAAPGVPPDETADARQYIQFPHTPDGTYLLGIRGKSCSSDYDILEFTIGSIPVVTKYELFNMAGGTYLGLIEPGVTLPHVPNFNIRITTTGPHNAVRAQMNSPSRANGWPKSYVNGLTPPATTTRSEVWLFGPGWSSGGLDPAGVYELDFWVWADRAPDDTTNTYLRKAENIVFSMQTGVITGSVSVDLYRDDTGTKIATVEDGTDYEWPEPWETQFNVSNIPHKGWEILTYYLKDGEYELVIGYGQAEGPSSPTVHTKAYRCFTAGAVQGSSANVLYAWPAPPESPYYPNPEPITYGYYKQVLNLTLDGEVTWTHEIHMGLLEEVVQYAKPYNLLTKTNGAHSMDYITAGRANFVINPDGSLSDTYLSGQVAGGDTYNGTQRQNTVEGVTCNVYYTLNGVGLKDGGGMALDLINRNVGKGDIYIQKYYVKASDFPDITSFEKFWYTLTLGKALDIVEFGATLY